MNAMVVYESLWGNTAAIASAIAEGIGSGARAMPVDEVTGEALGAADLIVAGAPVFGFSLPTESMRKNIATNPQHSSHPPDVSHPSLRSWLDKLPRGAGRYATFETRIWWSPRGATGDIAKRLENAGYRELATRERFVVEGSYGPLREGEIDRARAWGATLAGHMS